MITRNLVSRLERLEAYLAPPSDDPVMVIHMTCVGEEERTIQSGAWLTAMLQVTVRSGVLRYVHPIA